MKIIRFIKIGFFLVFNLCLFIYTFGQTDQTMLVNSSNSYFIKPNKTLWYSGANPNLNNLDKTLQFKQVDSNGYLAITSNGWKSY